MLKKSQIILCVLILFFALFLVALFFSSADNNLQNSQRASLLGVVADGSIATSTDSLLLETQQSVTTKEVPKLTEEEVYQSPLVKHIRFAFDNYLNGSNIGIHEIAFEPFSDMPNCGLNTFDKSYYKSKFIIWHSEPGKYGGINTDIVFIDKPDTIFWVWVYGHPEEDNEFSLRGFCSNGPPDDLKKGFPEMIKAMIHEGDFKYSL